MTSYIVVWGILPGLLLLLTSWSWIKLKILKGDKEQIGMFGKQFLFSLGALIVSVLILETGIVEAINENLLFDFVKDSFLEWLIYPVVLVILAKLGQRGEGK